LINSAANLGKYLLRRRQAVFLAALVALYVFILMNGLLIYRDYGISWDEPDQVQVGIQNYRYIFQGDPALFTYTIQYNGPFFELILYTLTGQPDSSILYQRRHLITFLAAYLGLLAFGALILYLFRKSWLAFCGVLFLYLSPRLFADFFYNSKDIPFMTLIVLGCLTQVWFLDSPTIWKAGLHGLVCAAAIATRIPGLFMPLLTLFFLEFAMLLDKKDEQYRRKRYVLPGFVLVLVCVGLTILFYPILWKQPLQSFLDTIHFMGHYPYQGSNFYLGQFYPAQATPWHYIPVWIAITTPLLYLLLMCLGSGVILTRLVNQYRARDLGGLRNNLLMVSWVLLPWLAIVLLHSVVYNGWRHLYFIYPGLLLFSLMGLDFLAGLKTLLPNIKKFILTAVVVIGLVGPAVFMIQNHPYQNLFFNRLAGPNMTAIMQRFDMDYWGLAYRKGLEFILANDPRQHILFTAETMPGWYNLAILPPDQRQRLEHTPDIQQADYYIANYAAHPPNYPYPNEVFSVKVMGAKILSVFKLK